MTSTDPMVRKLVAEEIKQEVEMVFLVALCFVLGWMCRDIVTKYWRG